MELKFLVYKSIFFRYTFVQLQFWYHFIWYGYFNIIIYFMNFAKMLCKLIIVYHIYDVAEMSRETLWMLFSCMSNIQDFALGTLHIINNFSCSFQCLLFFSLRFNLSLVMSLVVSWLPLASCRSFKEPNLT